jgi:hypothetical protein
MGIYLERYQSGEYKQVWDDLILFGNDVLKPDIYDDAAAVARETMKRVRHNVELLYERLIKLNYVFTKPEYTFRKAIPEDRQKHLLVVENILGKLPLSVRMWYEEVGDVVFMGSHPYLAYSAWRKQGPRSLLSDPFFGFFWEFEPEYLHMFPELGIPDFVEFSADDLHKAEYSGGTNYQIRISNNPMDSLVYNLLSVKTEIYFVDYWRWVFHWGGFSGIEKYLNSATSYRWESDWRFPLIELSYLTDGLLEF